MSNTLEQETPEEEYQFEEKYNLIFENKPKNNVNQILGQEDTSDLEEIADAEIDDNPEETLDETIEEEDEDTEGSEEVDELAEERAEECTALVTVKERRLMAAQTMFKKSIKISIKSFLISLSLTFLNLFI